MLVSPLSKLSWKLNAACGNSSRRWVNGHESDDRVVASYLATLDAPVTARGRELAAHLRDHHSAADRLDLVADAIAELLDPTPEPVLLLGRTLAEWDALLLDDVDRAVVRRVVVAGDVKYAGQDDLERIYEMFCERFTTP